MPVRRSPRERLKDVLQAIQKIERFLAGKTRMDFSADALIHDAVVRNLEVISKASRYVPDDLKSQEPAIPWRAISDIENWLPHGYDVLNENLIWVTIERDLPPLRDAVGRAAG
jgi:uncharacterized protein with HEPN domain